MVNMLSQGRAGIDQDDGQAVGQRQAAYIRRNRRYGGPASLLEEAEGLGRSTVNSIMKAVTPVLKTIADVVADVAKGIEELIADSEETLGGPSAASHPSSHPSRWRKRAVNVAAYDKATFEKAAARVKALQEEAAQAGRTKLELESP